MGSFCLNGECNDNNSILKTCNARREVREECEFLDQVSHFCFECKAKKNITSGIRTHQRCPAQCDHRMSAASGEYCRLPEGIHTIEIRAGKLAKCPIGEW